MTNIRDELKTYLLNIMDIMNVDSVIYLDNILQYGSSEKQRIVGTIARYYL